MNTKELIKLARKADIEGDLELADFIDRQLLAISNNKNIREAAGFSDSLSKMSRGVGNFFGNIGNFLGGYGGYNGPTNTKPLRDALQSVQNRSGLGKMFGSVGKEIEFSPEQLTELGDGLKSSLFNSRSKATPEVQSVIDEIINSGKVSGAKVTKPDGSSLSGPPAMNYKLDLLRQHAIQNKIINPRSGARLDDLDAIASGKPLAAGPRTVQRVNRNTKLLAGGAAAGMAAPGLYGMFAGQGPDTTGSAVPDGPMGPVGMPQLGPMGGFGGGYNGPQVGGPGMGGYAPTQPIGLGYANSVMDPASYRESAGYAPNSQYTGRSEREINPAAKFRSYEGMMRGEGAPAFNNQSYVGGYSQPNVAPVITPQVNVQPVAAPAVVPEQLTSIPPVNTGAAPQALPANFADALRPATPEEAARYEQPPAAPMTPEQIGAAMNPLATSGY
jgi:hypothetical protein